MAYTTINKSTDYFDTTLWTGNATARNITTPFQPDFTWIKPRSFAENHVLFDAVRGATKRIISNTADAEATNTTMLTAFNSTSFSIGTNNNVNKNSDTFASWNWKAGTSVSGNTTGSGSYKSYTGSVSTTSGFSIIKYQGNGSSGHTIPHHLGGTAEMIIIKNLGATTDWIVYHKDIPSANTRKISLNSTDYYNTDSSMWNNTSPNATNFTLGSSSSLNSNNGNYIAYCFKSITGFSKIGSYIGNNGGSNGVFSYLGFKPKFIMQKLATNESGGQWYIRDDARAPINVVDTSLYANSSNAENNSADIDFLSNGFKTRENGQSQQDAGFTYIYMAFGQTLVGSNKVPCTAR